MENQRIALCDARGPLNNLIDNLSGKGGEVWLEALKRFLRKENPWEPAHFPVWKIITLGDPFDLDALLETVSKDYEIREKVVRLFREISVEFAGEPTEVDLIAVTPKELGLKWQRQYPRELVETRLLEYGYTRCPVEVAIQLLRQTQKQDYLDFHVLFMEPITVPSLESSSRRSKGEVLALEWFAPSGINLMSLPRAGHVYEDGDYIIAVRPREVADS